MFASGGDLSTSPAFGDYERLHKIGELTEPVLDRLARGAINLELWGAPLEPLKLSLAATCPAAAAAAAAAAKAKAEAEAAAAEAAEEAAAEASEQVEAAALKTPSIDVVERMVVHGDSSQSTSPYPVGPGRSLHRPIRCCRPRTRPNT